MFAVVGAGPVPGGGTPLAVASAPHLADLRPIVRPVSATPVLPVALLGVSPDRPGTDLAGTAVGTTGTAGTPGTTATPGTGTAATPATATPGTTATPGAAVVPAAMAVLPAGTPGAPTRLSPTPSPGRDHG